MMTAKIWGRLLTVLPLLALGCVSTGTYEEAVKSANDANTALEANKRASATKERELQQKLALATAEETRLREELQRLGENADALAAEKGSLSVALGDTKARLEDLQHARAAAENRARLYRDLALRLKKMVDAGDLWIALRDGRMVLQLPNDVLFDTGQTDIKPRGRATLKLLAAVLRTLDGRNFQVAGHTDNVPIDRPRFPSNWELSTARGVEVVHFLIAQGVAPNALAAAGYGEFDPIAPNEDPKGRARNRRIEITLQPNVNEIVSVPDVR